ncbi:MAG: hypothetical protein M3083_23550 [Actinomycetota bacterium]|nr:hypothetical protein [Actinomycetota bacterium]
MAAPARLALSFLIGLAGCSSARTSTPPTTVGGQPPSSVSGAGATTGAVTSPSTVVPGRATSTTGFTF